MNRGHRGGALFLDDADRRRFLGAVAELPERFALEVHAFVLMHNHYLSGSVSCWAQVSNLFFGPQPRAQS
jgi:hypothetical protein